MSYIGAYCVEGRSKEQRWRMLRRRADGDVLTQRDTDDQHNQQQLHRNPWSLYREGTLVAGCKSKMQPLNKTQRHTRMVCTTSLYVT